MARPSRPKSEREAVRALAAPGLSCRCNAARVASRAVAAYLADMARDDPLERALFDARQLLDPDPLHALATAEDSALVERFTRERLERFEARGCRQLSPAEWQVETASIAAAAEAYLARRYREHLK